MVDQSWYTRPPGVRDDLSAGGIVLRREAGKWLVALVAEAGLSSYFLPKGRVETGEGLEVAARREILEEAGLSDLQLQGELGVYERLNYSKNAWKVIHYFLFYTSQVEGHPTDARHNYVCTWHPLDALPDLLWPEQSEILTKLKRMPPSTPTLPSPGKAEKNTGKKDRCG